MQRGAHPDDRPQEGLLVAGSAGEDGALVGLWADSWHQQPAPMSMTGALDTDGALLRVSGDYAGDWQWRIELTAGGGDDLTFRMENVIPDSAATADIPAGPYSVMLAAMGRPADL